MIIFIISCLLVGLLIAHWPTFIHALLSQMILPPPTTPTFFYNYIWLLLTLLWLLFTLCHSTTLLTYATLHLNHPPLTSLQEIRLLLFQTLPTSRPSLFNYIRILKLSYLKSYGFVPKSVCASVFISATYTPPPPYSSPIFQILRWGQLLSRYSPSGSLAVYFIVLSRLVKNVITIDCQRWLGLEEGIYRGSPTGSVRLPSIKSDF